MKFKKTERKNPAQYENDLVGFWKKNDIFRKSVENRPKTNNFVFYDGPPFLTGTPHHGHLLVSTVKDSVARYKTMQGKRVERRWGWDCHGLPAEVFVEDKLGITNKKEIGTKISIAEYVKECRAAMVKTGTQWEDTIHRLGRWVEFEGAYKTMDPEYMESVWWAFAQLYEKGKVYESEKILVYCVKDATPISKSEVAMENSYKLVTEPSVYVYFKLEGSDEYLLAWTTTPWTLPANVALAVNDKLEYSLVKYGDKKIYVATEALQRVFTDEKHQPLDFEVIGKARGSDLSGRNYEPLFENHGPNAHKVLSASFVNPEDGTGIVHQAPAYGEDDYELCKQHNIPIVSIVDENGHYTEGRWLGEYIWDINKEIAKTLLRENKALKIDYIKHEYPHCHRCGTKLMYRAHPSWFMDIQGQKQKMLEETAKTSWVPEHLRDGRFKYIIESAPDWNLSRDRYWATPIPVWKGARNDGTEVIKVIGSYSEFYELTGKKLKDYHLPNVMDVEFELDGVTLKHVGKVMDCWFESGSMPFAQFHYPFENKQQFEQNFPADFIAEAIDQTRGWFYSLMAVNTGLFGKTPFKNLVCTGFINAADGKKMSKKLKNYTDPMELMDQYSADSFRLLMLFSPLTSGENFNLSDRDVKDVYRKLNMVWNMYDFFTMYAEVDQWEWDGDAKDPSHSTKNQLDKWIISRVHQLGEQIQFGMQQYDISAAARLIVPFIEEASNWYVRRSRRRFWKSGGDRDKDDAYRTLHYVLVYLAKVMAPFTPFMAEELYKKLTGEQSVHLLDWPKVGEINQDVLSDMQTTRRIIEKGLSLRMGGGDNDHQIKVRQPLSSLSYGGNKLDKFYENIIAEEVNVKEVNYRGSGTSGKTVLEVDLDKHITPELRREGMMRDVVRNIQNARKKAGLNVDDRIKFVLITEDQQLSQAIDEHIKTISSEVLGTYSTDSSFDHSFDVKVDENHMKVSLSKI